MFNFVKNIKFNGDRVIWVVALLLALISILAVYSSIVTLAYKHDNGDTEKYLFRHGTMLIGGLIFMYYAHKLKFNYYSRIAQVAIWAAGFILIITLLMGVNRNDASRWLLIPIINREFQPSDFAKLALILYLARLLSRKQTKINNFKEGVVPLLIPIIIICGLILPANVSTAAALFTSCLVMLFVGNVAFKHLMLIIGGAIAAFGLLILISFAAPNLLPRLETWKNRITNYEETNPEANYQVNQAKIAIATGGLWGLGLNNGSSKTTLPHPYSDMIYPYSIQVGGSLFAGFGLIMLYLILLYRSVRIAIKCPKHFGTLAAVGLSFSLVLQAMINMAVGVNLIPVTGQPLPLVSMGVEHLYYLQVFRLV